ncbi:MAG: FG-GAP-like repeat-containing protein [bacterium]
MRHFVAITTLLCLALAGVAPAKVLTIERAEPVTEPPRHGVDLGVSDRNLLDLEYDGKYGLPRQALDGDNPQIIKVLAIKVNFVKEDPESDTLTTGNGNFELAPKDSFYVQNGHLIDATPHNSDYFRAHLRALAEYWRVVSNGRVLLEYELYPVESDSAYQLDETMGYYGSQPPQYGLGEFMSDAWLKADADPGIDFYNEAAGQDNYDAYIVFHPGSDQQNNLGWPFGPDTPSDLYTGFVKLGLPVVVEDGHTIIYDGMLMPETASQDNRVIALNAVFAHEFGHQLGLIDLYDTRTFLTMCGDFALMDNNGLGVNIDFGETVPVFVQGVMPVFPCAWSRAYLGFVDVVEVSDGNNVKVAAAEIDTSLAQVLLVPINAEEYYLIENRQLDLDGRDPTAVQADSLTDVILWPRSAVAGQGDNNREYDFLIPGSGMLIWHVDERVARLDYDGDGVDNFADNQLQWYSFEEVDQFGWDNHRRFVALEEADGIIDFGGSYFTGYGDKADMFEINGNSNFGPYTNPNTAGNNNGYTGITIDDISAAFRVMTCDISSDDRVNGWPHYIGPNAQPLISYDLNGDGSDELITAVDKSLLAYKADGTSFFTPREGDEVVVKRETYYGEGEVFDTLAVFGRVSENKRISETAAIGDLDGDGFAEIAVLANTNTIACFTSFSLGYVGEALKLFESTWRTDFRSAPMIADFDSDSPGREIGIVSAGGALVIFDIEGNLLGDQTLAENAERLLTDDQSSFRLAVHQAATERRGAAAADFDHDGSYESAEVYLVGTLRFNLTEPLELNVGGPIFSAPALGDLDDDGLVEIVFCGDNLIYAYGHNGEPVANFPITFNHYIPSGQNNSTPTLADIDGDGRMEVFVTTANGELAGFNLRGERLTYFPKDAGGTISSPPVFASSASGAVLFTLSQEGEINAFHSPEPRQIDWQGNYGGAANLGSFTRQLTGETQYNTEIAYLYNYPNPAATETTIRFALQDDNRVSLRLYNLAGDLVFETEFEGLGAVDNEYQLDCSGFASGVYFCQLETAGGTREHCSVAIIR